MLSLCKKAGKLVMGFDAVSRELHKGYLLILAGDLSPRTVENIRVRADQNRLPVKKLDRTMDELWAVLGRRTGVLLVTDQGLGRKISAMIDDHDKEE
jgi:ribosomal protein L30E